MRCHRPSSSMNLSMDRHSWRCLVTQKCASWLQVRRHHRAPTSNHHPKAHPTAHPGPPPLIPYVPPKHICAILASKSFQEKPCANIGTAPRRDSTFRASIFFPQLHEPNTRSHGPQARARSPSSGVEEHLLHRLHRRHRPREPLCRHRRRHVRCKSLSRIALAAAIAPRKRRDEVAGSKSNNEEPSTDSSFGRLVSLSSTAAGASSFFPRKKRNYREQ